MFKRLLPLLVACIMLACTSGELTRSKATKLIEKTEGYDKGLPEITLTIDEVQRGVNSGLWIIHRHGYIMSRDTHAAELTQEGSKYFSSMAITPGQLESWNLYVSVAPRARVNYVLVEMTGIRDVPDSEGGGKIAEYRYKWDFSRLPEPARKIFDSRGPQDARALFRHYDDGWRLEKFL